MTTEEQLREVRRRQDAIVTNVALSAVFAVCAIAFTIAGLLARHC
jgi:hypothetical protein